VIVFKDLGRYGRFGNQLFQIASTIGIAIKNHQSFGFPRWINYDHKERFGSPEDIDVQKFFKNELPLLVEVDYLDRFIHWGYHDITLQGNVNLVGHMQSDKYFLHCMDTIRHYLKMKDEPAQSEQVAIHFRAGDYEQGENVYHPRLTMDYYNKAMDLFPGEKFLVFSDDQNRTREMFGDRVDYATGNYIEDFAKMKKCKSFICANSSYSVMAAILGEHPEKKIVCPKKWFGDVAGITGDDCHPQNAIVI
jgi:hypothetical protein